MDCPRSGLVEGEFRPAYRAVPGGVPLSNGPIYSACARLVYLALLTIYTGCAILSDKSPTVPQGTDAGTALATVSGSAEDGAPLAETTPWEASVDKRRVADVPDPGKAPSRQKAPDVEMRFVAAAPGKQPGRGASFDRFSHESSFLDEGSTACLEEVPDEPRDATPLAGWYEVSGALDTNASHPHGVADDPTVMAMPAVYFDGQSRREDDQAPRRPSAAGSQIPEEIALPETDADSTEESPLVPLTPITRLGVDIRPKGADLPVNFAREVFLSRGMVVYSRDSDGSADLYPVFVASPDFCHYPLYFEQFNLERFGYSHGIAQPFFSAAHFFCRLPAMPYLVTVDRPCQCMATSGPYGPGNYCPCPHVLPPWNLRAALFEAGLVTGLVFIIP